MLVPHSTSQDVAAHLEGTPEISRRVLGTLMMLRDPEAQSVLREAIAAALPVEGISETAAAIALGDVSRLPEELDTSAKVTINAQGWPLLDFAAGLGEKAMVKALLLRRFSPTQRTMRAAIQNARTDVVRMLQRKVPLGEEAACAVPANAPDVFELVRDAFPVSKWPVNSEDFRAFVTYSAHEPDVLLDYVSRLAAEGAPFNSNFVYNFLSSVPDHLESECLVRLFDILDIDWNAALEHGYTNEPKTLVEYALQEHPVASIAAFAERNLLQPLHVEEHFPDAAEKSALLAAQGTVAAEPTIAEYLGMGDAAIRVARLGILAGKDGTLAGLRIGATEDDVRAVPLKLKGARVKLESPGGTIMEEEVSAHHRLSVELKKRKVRHLEYAATFPGGDPRPAELTSALKELWSDALGKPKGRKNLKWSTDEYVIEVGVDTYKPSEYERLGSIVWSIMMHRP